MSVKDARERRQCQGLQELRVIGNHTRREENEGFLLLHVRFFGVAFGAEFG
jgi:hypothetical protein